MRNVWGVFLVVMSLFSGPAFAEDYSYDLGRNDVAATYTGTTTTTYTETDSGGSTVTVTSISSTTSTNSSVGVNVTFAVAATFQNYGQCMHRMRDLLRATGGSLAGISGSGFTASEGIEPYCRVLFPVVSSVTATDPCQQIVQTCEVAGFKAGEWQKGNGLWNDCWDPLMQGAQANTSVQRTIPLPDVSASVIAACKAEEQSSSGASTATVTSTATTTTTSTTGSDSGSSGG